MEVPRRHECCCLYSRVGMAALFFFYKSSPFYLFGLVLMGTDYAAG